MIYTHKREASELRIFQVRNSTPSAGVSPSLCEDSGRRAAAAGTQIRARGASRGRNQSAA